MRKSNGPTARRANRNVDPGSTHRSKNVATPKQIAQMKFEACKHSPEEWRNEEWLADGADVLPFVRCAWLVMFKTKDELETVVKGLINDKSFEGTWDGIERAQGFFEGFMTVLKAAEMRLMSAATAVALAGGAE